MIVEHTFVTTLDAPEALQAVADMLRPQGFLVTLPAASVLEASRGKKTAARAKALRDLPQYLRLEFDRGRISLAASLQTRRKPKPEHKAFLLVLVNTIERRLVHNDPNAALEWAAIEAVHEQKRRTAVRRHYIALFSLLGFIVLLFALIIIAAIASH